MPARLPDSIRREVIQKLLEGQSRDSIASECGISTGATSAIIAEFTQLVGTDLARQLRELSLGLKRMGMSLAQCSKGFRIYEILEKLGVDGNNLELFVTDLYDKSRRIGLGPQELCKYLLDLMNFPADCFRTIEVEGQEGREVTVVPLISQIPDYIVRKRTELKNLKQEIAEEKQEKSRLDGAIVEAREIHSKILAATEADRTNMEWLSTVKIEMKNVGLPVDEPHRLAKAAKWVQERGYNLAEIVQAFSDYQRWLLLLRAVQEEVSDHQKLAKSLVQDNANLEEMNKMTLSILDDLREMGLGLRELKRLDSDLKEISRANGLPSSDGSSTERFLEVLEENYDTTLGLKTEIQEQRRELTNLRKEINLQRVIYNISPRLNSLLETLLRKGFDEDGIVRAAAYLENQPHLAESARNT